MLEQVKAISLADGLGAARVARLRLLLEQTQRALTRASAQVEPATKKVIEPAGRCESKSTLNRSSSLPFPVTVNPTSRLILAYADHLRLRRERDRCLEVVEQALELTAGVAANTAAA